MPMIELVEMVKTHKTLITITYGPQEAQHGFRWAAGEHNICFYTDDRRIAGQYPIWVQTSLTTMVRIFDRVGL